MLQAVKNVGMRLHRQMPKAWLWQDYRVVLLYCILTDKTFSIANSLMLEWIVSKKDEQEMEQIITSKIEF
ncbi:MAG: hypothetical protein WC782_00065 [Methylococcaceae bacterium]|jgi:hypothetical protein